MCVRVVRVVRRARCSGHVFKVREKKSKMILAMKVGLGSALCLCAPSRWLQTEFGC